MDLLGVLVYLFSQHFDAGSTLGRDFYAPWMKAQFAAPTKSGAANLRNVCLQNGIRSWIMPIGIHLINQAGSYCTYSMLCWSRGTLYITTIVLMGFFLSLRFCWKNIFRACCWRSLRVSQLEWKILLPKFMYSAKILAQVTNRYSCIPIFQ